jgi:hypothetical protein
MRKGGPKKVSIKAIRYSGESISKAIVLLQIPEVLSDEATVLLCKKFGSAK